MILYLRGEKKRKKKIQKSINLNTDVSVGVTGL